MGTTPSGEADNIDLAPSVCGDHTSEINTRQRWCFRHTLKVESRTFGEENG